MAVAGVPLRMSFDRRRVFRLTFRGDPGVQAPTEIFVPEVQYPHGYRVTVSDGDWTLGDDPQVLRYRPTAGASMHTIRVYPR
jgi:Glycoside hydrolase family 5 C-terminal domain